MMADDLSELRAEDLSSAGAQVGWRGRFESLRGRRASIFAYIFITHIYYPLKNHHIRMYSSPSPPAFNSRVCRTTNPIPSTGPTAAAAAPAGTGTGSSKAKDASATPNLHSDQEPWRWRAFPRMWRVLVWYRIINTVYMVYVVLRNVYPASLEVPLRQLLSPSKPAHCYIMGRFMPRGDVRRPAAVLFAACHLFWRYFQLYKPVPNYMISTLYFMLLDDRDILKYYRLLAARSREPEPACAQQRAVRPAHWAALAHRAECGLLAGPGGGEQRDHAGGNRGARARATCLGSGVNAGAVAARRREEMFHDIMSLRVDKCDSLMFKLRPNRTPEACRLLRKHMTESTVLWIIIFVPLALAVAALLMQAGYTMRRYFDDYPGCSPGLEELYERGQLHGWHLHLRGHQIITIVVDTFENAILWSECGLAGMFSVPLSMLLHYDLVLYWAYLDKRLAQILRDTRNRHWWHMAKGSSGNARPLRKAASLRAQSEARPGDRLDIGRDDAHRSKLIYEFQMEWQDFIKQIKQSDAFVGDAISCFVAVWFTLFCIFMYSVFSISKGALPLVYKLMLLWMWGVVTSHMAALLKLHRHCLSSYTHICSLMAYDRSVHRLNFIQIMDYFIRKRTCFTLCRKMKMTATTYLTIVGWSFSCFFILGNVYRN